MSVYRTTDDARSVTMAYGGSRKAANDAPSSPFMAIIKSHIDSHKTAGEHWPPSAEFAVEYRMRAWPLGFSEKYVEFFDNREQLDAWLEQKHEWMRYEDNYVAYRGLNWDLGPCPIPGLEYLTGNL